MIITRVAFAVLASATLAMDAQPAAGSGQKSPESTGRNSRANRR